MNWKRFTMVRFLFNWTAKHSSNLKALNTTFAITAVLLLLATVIIRGAITREINGGRLTLIRGLDEEFRPEFRHGSVCSAVRYTSPACDACTLDRLGNWPKLRRRLLESGCLIYYVQPSPRDRPTADSTGTDLEGQVRYVSPIFAAETHLRSTPTTLLIDRALAVRWQHAGVLADDNLREASDAIARVAQR